MIFGLLGACIQEEAVEQAKVPDFVDETLLKTPQDVAKAEAILKVTKALRIMYKEKMVVEEVNAAIATGLG